MTLNLPLDINKVKGFLDPIEGEALYHYTKKFTKDGNALEIAVSYTHLTLPTILLV